MKLTVIAGSQGTGALLAGLEVVADDALTGRTPGISS